MAKVLERKVNLINSSKKKDFKGIWDSKLYLIEPGHFVEIDSGIAEHFMDQERYPGNELRTEEILPDPELARTPSNPWVTDGVRGKAFVSLLSKEDPKNTEDEK